MASRRRKVAESFTGKRGSIVKRRPRLRLTAQAGLRVRSECQRVVESRIEGARSRASRLALSPGYDVTTSSMHRRTAAARAGDADLLREACRAGWRPRAIRVCRRGA